MPKEQREIDREVEEARQAAIDAAVVKRNAELAAGADPDRTNEQPAKPQPKAK